MVFCGGTVLPTTNVLPACGKRRERREWARETVAEAIPGDQERLRGVQTRVVVVVVFGLCLYLGRCRNRKKEESRATLKVLLSGSVWMVVTCPELRTNYSRWS